MSDVFVIRTEEPERVVEFLSQFGLKFVPEQHGNGQPHHACEVDGNVLEIYPPSRHGTTGASFYEPGVLSSDNAGV